MKLEKIALLSAALVIGLTSKVLANQTYNHPPYHQTKTQKIPSIPYAIMPSLLTLYKEEKKCYK